MGVSWAFAVLLVWPALQLPLLWAFVRYFDLRNDDGPADPVGYSLASGSAGAADERGRELEKGRNRNRDRNRERVPGRCARCGEQNEPVARYCRDCLSVL